MEPTPKSEIPWDELGPLEQIKAIVDDQEFFLERPKETEKLRDHPSVRGDIAREDYVPYWTDLWPAARMLAKVIWRETWTPGTTALEIGCGLGLPGIVALAKGLKVIFTDYDACALHFAALNAELNGFSDFRCLRLDWNHPPEDLQVPLIFAADLVYEERHVVPIVALIKKLLLRDGTCYLTDQDRLPANAVRNALDAENFHYTTQIIRAGEPPGRRLKGTLYRIKFQA